MTLGGIGAAFLLANILIEHFSITIIVVLLLLMIVTLIQSCITRPSELRKPLLILDMNKLLVCRAFKPKLNEEFPDYVGYVHEATLLGKHYTWKRPHLDEFLQYAFEHFEVAVWSSAWRENVDKLCEFVFTPEQRALLLFEWDQTNCDCVEPHPDPAETKPLYEKPLQKVWKHFPKYDESNTIIFDDSPLKMRNNPPACVFQPSSWIVTQVNDRELSPDGGSIYKKLTSKFIAS